MNKALRNGCFIFVLSCFGRSFGRSIKFVNNSVALVFVDIYLYICSMKTFTEEETKNIICDYKRGISIKKLQYLHHTHSNNITKLLTDNGIDIHNHQGFGPRIHREKGYWNSREHCEELAKTCRNLSEFFDKSSIAYKTAKMNGWLDEFADKYFSDKPEFPSLLLKIHCVYAYEIEPTHSVYIGRTNCLKRRDNDHRRPTSFDTLYDFCNRNGLDIPEPKILVGNIDGKESQLQEDEWVNRYRENGWNILNRAKTGANSGSLGATARKWTYDTCKEAAAECKNKEEFKHKYSRAHNVSRSNGWIDEFFPVNSKKKNGCFDTLEACKEACKGYKTIMQIRREYPFLSQQISRNKWTEEIRRYINENVGDRMNDRFLRNNVRPLAFNDEEYFPAYDMGREETDFYNIVKQNNKNAIIDKNSVCGDLFYVRVDEFKTVFLLVGVHNNGNLYNNLANNRISKILEYCNVNGVRLVVIYDSELYYNRNILEYRISYYLHTLDRYAIGKIGARKCNITTIRKEDAEKFLNRNHIQGFSPSSIYLGAYFDGVLVAVMTLKKGGINREGWELNRYAGNNRYIISGLADKMFKYFISKFLPDTVVSFADMRWGVTANNIYEKMGFVKEGVTALSYYYFGKDEKHPQLLHKLLLKKTSLSKKYGFPLTMTETEMARELGYDRIWDCGLVKYVWAKQ